MPRRFEIIALLLLFTAILSPRLPAIESFGTVDEASWLMFNANFYYALGQRDFQYTVSDYHPAVTTMWVGAAGMMLDFPMYRGLGQGYFEKEEKLSDFFLEHGHHPKQILKTQRLITTMINSCLLGLVYVLIKKIVGWIPAFTAIIFLSFDPFFLGHTRLLTHEGMMSLLLLVSILAFFNFLYRGQQWQFLILSSISAALAILTKSSATVILPFVGIWCLLGILQRTPAEEKDKSTLWTRGRRAAGIWSSWASVIVFVYVAIWPGMWVNPKGMLSYVYGNAFSYAFQGHRMEYIEDRGNSQTSEVQTGLTSYAKALLWRTTPVVWIGLAFSIAMLLLKRFSGSSDMNQIVFALLSFGLIFFLMMSIAKGRQSHHYIMVVFVNICVAAGLGLNSMVAAARKRLSNRFGWVLSCSLFLGLISIQIVSALNYYPYYFNYTNPLMESLEAGIQTPVSGYGEGLELAASYLAEKPGAEEMIVMSFRGVGPFSYYFPGNTENMFASENWSPSMIDRLRISDYMVIYYYHQVRRHMPEKLLRDIASIEPEHTIWINGVEYVRIYPVRDLPETVFVPDILD